MDMTIRFYFDCVMPLTLPPQEKLICFNRKVHMHLIITTVRKQTSNFLNSTVFYSMFNTQITKDLGLAPTVE